MSSDHSLRREPRRVRSIQEMAPTDRPAVQMGFDVFLVSAVLLCLLAVFIPVLRNGPHVFTPLVLGVGTAVLVGVNRRLRVHHRR